MPPFGRKIVLFRLLGPLEPPTSVNPDTFQAVYESPSTESLKLCKTLLLLFISPSVRKIAYFGMFVLYSLRDILRELLSTLFRSAEDAYFVTENISELRN
jgi:hypothetical protein